MDISFIEQLLDLPRIRVRNVHILDNEIQIWIYIPDHQHRYPRCGRQHKTVTETTEVKIRDLSMAGKNCYLIVQKGRLHCPCSTVVTKHWNLLILAKSKLSALMNFYLFCATA